MPIEENNKQLDSIQPNQDDPRWLEARKISFGIKEQVVVKNNITGKEIVVKLDRSGTSDEEMSKALVSNMSSEKKDALLANYVFQRGLENPSYLMELMRLQGHTTKEMRQFKNQMRFDFEMFVARYVEMLRHSSERNWKILAPLEDGHLMKIEDALAKLIKSKGNIEKVFPRHIYAYSPERLVLLSNAVNDRENADFLEKAVKKITAAREASKGKNIYLDKLGRAHSLYEEDVIDIVKSEKEELMKNVKSVDNKKP